MRTRKRFLAASIGSLATAGLAASSFTRASAADTYTLRYSSTGQANTAWNQAMIRLAVAVKRRSNGRLIIDLYPNSQLAKEVESIQGLTTGVVDLALESSVYLEPLFPQMQVFTLPFMFKNYAAAFKVVDGPIGDELFAQFATKGIMGLAWGSTGFRELESVNRAIRVPGDMKGLRFRIQGGAVNVAMAQALSVIPVTIDITEVYTSLNQHTIDAVDNTLAGVITNKYYTVMTHLAMTNHVFNFQPLVASKAKIESLPPDLQKILKEEAKASLPSWRNGMVTENAEALATLKSKGIIVTEIDYNAFRKVMDPVYAVLASKIGPELIQRVSRTATS